MPISVNSVRGINTHDCQQPRAESVSEFGFNRFDRCIRDIACGNIRAGCGVAKTNNSLATSVGPEVCPPIFYASMMDNLAGTEIWRRRSCGRYCYRVL
jgi:hypothetical protein